MNKPPETIWLMKEIFGEKWDWYGTVDPVYKNINSSVKIKYHRADKSLGSAEIRHLIHRLEDLRLELLERPNLMETRIEQEIESLELIIEEVV